MRGLHVIFLFTQLCCILFNDWSMTWFCAFGKNLAVFFPLQMFLPRDFAFNLFGELETEKFTWIEKKFWKTRRQSGSSYFHQGFALSTLLDSLLFTTVKTIDGKTQHVDFFLISQYQRMFYSVIRIDWSLNVINCSSSQTISTCHVP